MNFLIISNRDIGNAAHFKSPEYLEAYLSSKLGKNISILIFVFWSWKVPAWMLKKYKCYGFHTGYLTEGKGKGGSPIENLQKLRVIWAQMNVFEMNEGFDDGKPILAIPISLAGTKKDIIWKIAMMIPTITAYLTEDRPPIPERFKRILK